MPGRGYQLMHSDAFTAELEALGLDSTVFGAAGVPAPIFQALVPRRAGVFDASAHTFGTASEPATYTRTSAAMARNSSGSWVSYTSGLPRPHYSRAGVFLGYLIEPAATNVFLNSDAPATQDIALTVGNWTLSLHGAGSCISSNGTGTATGHGTAVDGTDVTIDVTGAGTFTFTISGSPVLVQVESGPFSTSPIVTAGASASRSADGCSWAAQPTGFSQSAGMVSIDYVTLHDSTPSGYSNYGIVNFSNSAFNVLYGANASNCRSFDGTTSATVAFNSTGTVREQMHRLITRWGGSQFQLLVWNPDDGWRASSATAYDGAWDYSGGNVLEIARTPKLPVALKNLRIWNRDLSAAEIQRIFTP